MGDRGGLGHFLGFLTLVSVLLSAQGHVRFVCPRPRTPRTDIFRQLPSHELSTACGLGDPDFSETEEDVTVVSPGPFTLRFEETHIHTDSPFHISLHSYGNDSHSCSLLNHIPHNNMAAIESPDCKDDSYPIGHCSKSTYYVTVNIPDISCEQCYLKLSFVTLDKTPVSELPCKEQSGTCKTYISCANIRILSSNSGRDNGLESCVSYRDNLLGSWPYTQQQLFQVELTSDIAADFTVNYYDMSLQYKIPTKDIGKVLSVALYKKDDEKQPVLRKSVALQDNTGDVYTGQWTLPDSLPIPQLVSGQYQVNIATTQKTYVGRLKYLRDMYDPNIYVPHGASYSKQGWLNGPEFVGPGATYSEGVHPAGQCAPQPYHYFAAMNPSLESLHRNVSSHDPHGVLSADFLDDRVHVTAVFHGLGNRAQSVTLHGPALAGAKSMTIPLLRSGDVKKIDVTLDAADAMPLVLSTKFLRRVTVDTDDGETKLCSHLEQGMVAEIKGAGSGLYGVATFQFLKEGSITYSIMLAMGQSDTVKTISLNGPAYPGMVGPSILELREFFGQDVTDNTFFSNHTIKASLSSKLLFHLWNGHLYLDVRLEGQADGSRNISGQISPPGEWYCNNNHWKFCPHVNLYLNGEKPDPGARHVPTTAQAVLFVDRANALEYSIQVKFSRREEVVLWAALMEGSIKHLIISKFQSYSLPDNRHIHQVNGRMPQISSALSRLLRDGKLRLAVATSAYRNGEITGDIPALERPHCSRPIMTRVQWDLARMPTYGLNLMVGDRVLFSYSGNDTVYRFQNRMKYRHCDFSGATLVGRKHDDPQNGPVQVQYKMKKKGEYYFGSKVNCNASLSTTINVAGRDTRPFTDCEASVYDLWYQAKMSSRGGTNAVGAIIGGSILAVTSLILIVLFDRRRRFKPKSNSGFQRF